MENEFQDEIMSQEDNEIDVLDKFLCLLIKMPQKAVDSEFIELALTDERYIIWFYINKYSSFGTPLTRDVLSSALKINCKQWLAPKSILVKNRNKINREYLQLHYSDRLINDKDYEDVLYSIVMKKYDQIVGLNTSFMDFDLLKLQVLETSKYQTGFQLVTEFVEILEKGKVYNKKEFTRNEIMDYAELRIAELRGKLTNEVSATDYQAYLNNQLANANTFGKPIFEWDLGECILPPINPSFFLYLLGAPKAGKSRFSLGEIAYPALIQGKNVKYDSGELDAGELTTLLLMKHIYKQHSYKLIEEDVGVINQLAIKKYSHMTLDEQERWNTVDIEDREVILDSRYDLFFSNNYGKFYPEVPDDRPFDLDTAESNAMNAINTLGIELLIYDHIGLFTSSRKDINVTTEALKACKRIAKNRKKSIGVVAINHIKTSQVTQVLRGDYEDVEGHNSSEGRKSANAMMVLAADEEEAKKGLIRLIIPISRKAVRGVTLNNTVYTLVNEGSHCEYNAI